MPGSAQVVLANRLRKAAQVVADDAKLRASRWSRRVPLSIRMQGGASRITIAAGGRAAPQAYTMEGRADGRPIAHPVYGRGPRVRGPLTGDRYDPPGWTWEKQIPRPFLREAIDAKQDEMTRVFAEVVDDWAHDLGYK